MTKGRESSEPKSAFQESTFSTAGGRDSDRGRGQSHARAVPGGENALFETRMRQVQLVRRSTSLEARDEAHLFPRRSGYRQNLAATVCNTFRYWRRRGPHL